MFRTFIIVAQAIFAPCDVHAFSGEELDCEFFLNYNPYDSLEEFDPEFWEQFELSDDFVEITE